MIFNSTDITDFGSREISGTTSGKERVELPEIKDKDKKEN